MKKVLPFIIFATAATAATAASRGAPRFDAVTSIGDVLQFMIPVSAMAYSVAIDDWQGVGQLGLTAGSTMATTYALKYTVREERPYQEEDTKGHTFPSGHTALAFSGAGYWQMRYGWYVGAPMYAAAAFVGYSRTYARMHNWLDVAAASAIGIGFNYLFTTPYIPKGTQISVSPTDGGAMLRFNSQF